MLTSFGGLVLALLIGVPAGMLMAKSRVADSLLGPLVKATYSLPKTALIPLFFLWFGIGATTDMVLVMLACLLPLLVYAYHGVHAVPRVLVWSAQCMGTPPARIFYAIELPASLAAILTGLRIALGFSFVLAISAEMIAAKSGIGRLMVEYGENGAYDYMFAAVSAIVIVAFAADRGLIALTDMVALAGAAPRGGSCLMRARVTALSRQIAQLYPLLFVIIIWQAAANFGWVRPIFLPSFSSVVVKAWALAGSGELWPPLFVSLYRAGAGLALAMVIGIPVDS